MVERPWREAFPRRIVADMDNASAHAATVVAADAIDTMPAAPLGPIEGVHRRVLWSSPGGAESGVLTIEGGHHLGVHRHRVNHHHIWLVDGAALVGGALIGPGSYVHVPCGVDHDIDARDTSGCTLFYVYEPPEG